MTYEMINSVREVSNSSEGIIRNSALGSQNTEMSINTCQTLVALNRLLLHVVCVHRNNGIPSRFSII